MRDSLGVVFQNSFFAMIAITAVPVNTESGQHTCSGADSSTNVSRRLFGGFPGFGVSPVRVVMVVVVVLLSVWSSYSVTKISLLFCRCCPLNPSSLSLPCLSLSLCFPVCFPVCFRVFPRLCRFRGGNCSCCWCGHSLLLSC